MREQLSSQSINYAGLFSCLAILLCSSVWVLEQLFAGNRPKLNSCGAFLFSLVTAGIFAVAIRWSKTVYIDSTHLHVSSHSKEAKIALTDIDTAYSNSAGGTISITLRSESAFGKKITYYPKSGFLALLFPFLTGPHQRTVELIDKVNAAKDMAQAKTYRAAK